MPIPPCEAGREPVPAADAENPLPR